MNTKRLLVGMVFLSAIAGATASPAFADDADGGESAAQNVPGFFQTHSVILELVTVTLVLGWIAGEMGASSTKQIIQTDHQDFWRHPIGTSYTHLDMPQTPSSPKTIKRTVIILATAYLVLRFTCLSVFLSEAFQFFGGILDIFFQLVGGIFGIL